MKLLITGATGYVATEVLRQALLSPSFTSVVALARHALFPPTGVPAGEARKLQVVIVADYGSYPEAVKKQLEGADACIWTVAITPSKSMTVPFSFVREVCQDWTVSGFNAIVDANPTPKQPLRFLYLSGAAANDPACPRPKEGSVWMPGKYENYCKMRGETATQLFELAEKHADRIQVCVAKPGLITSTQRSWLRSLWGTALWLTGVVPTIDLKEISAALLYHASHGFEGTEGILLNSEMVALGKEILSKGT